MSLPDCAPRSRTPWSSQTYGSTTSRSSSSSLQGLKGHCHAGLDLGLQQGHVTIGKSTFAKLRSSQGLPKAGLWTWLQSTRLCRGSYTLQVWYPKLQLRHLQQQVWSQWQQKQQQKQQEKESAITNKSFLPWMKITPLMKTVSNVQLYLYVNSYINIFYFIYNFSSVCGAINGKFFFLKGNNIWE